MASLRRAVQLWGYALRHIEAGRAATFDTLIPLVGVVAAVLVLREAPLTGHRIGGALVVAGVGLVVSEPCPAVVPTISNPTQSWEQSARNRKKPRRAAVG